MCGRFVRSSDPEAFARQLGCPVPEAPPPSYNISPSTRLLAFTRTGRQTRAFLPVWGLRPAWFRRPSTGPINARWETAAEKPMFRRAWRQRRCLIAADGYYEWEGKPGRRQPWFIRLGKGTPFFFAGLWEESGERPTACILTTSAAGTLQRIHPRMPVIVPSNQWENWLAGDPGEAGPETPDLARTALEFELWPVSDRVNRPANDDPDLIRPLAA
ncbi:MAG: SOS response-associated peptidase [Gammaproteobacteria bacterium]|nr:MAG: SOS response-associated peptidase [Gammaproteobacteria bacterium]